MPNDVGVASRVKTIICEESGVSLAEMDSHSPFTDFGIDSLLSLNISSRLQEDLGLTVPSSAFVDFATLKELIDHLAPSDSSNLPSSSGSENVFDTYDDSSDTAGESAITDPEPTIMSMIRATIAEEAGISPEDLLPSTNLAELGVDSLLSLNIISKLHAFDINIPTNLFSDHQNLHEIEMALSFIGKDPPAPAPPVLQTNGTPCATSVRLQGSSSGSSKLFFLLPDGSGTAATYSPLPEFSQDVTVYGLNCPWLKTPQAMPPTLPQYVSRFIGEIRNRQPTGPYYLGGWSAGGILAYEAAQQLTRAGEVVETLILLDSPDPIGIQSPSHRMYDFLETLGILGTKGRPPPKWLRPHFTAFIHILDQYVPVPFAEGKTPKTHIIYARDGLCKNPGDPRPPEQPDDPREMRWILNNRSDFSGGGWRTLVGSDSLLVHVVDEANHYSMLAVEGSAKVSAIIADCLAR